MNLHHANKRLESAIRILIDKDKPAARNLTVLADDTFVVSYPKSGNTWVRFLLANLIWSDSITDFTNIEQRIPDIYKHSALHLESIPRPRYFKSHEYFDPRYPKVLYVVRDPRSVLVSYYNYEMRWRTRFKPETSYYDFTKLFLSGQLNCFGSWQENVLSWLRLRGHDNQRFCLIRYEDLKADSLPIMKTISSFLRLKTSEERLKLAVKNSSFQSMKNLETKAQEWERGVNNNTIPFVRKGSTSEWQQVLDTTTIKLINDHCGELMQELGYEV